MTWKWENCEGIISLADGGNGDSINIRFAVECKMDGVIDIQMQSVDWSAETSRIYDAFNSPNIYATRLSLSGKSYDGIIFSSDQLYVVGVQLNFSEGEKLSLLITAKCAELLASMPNRDFLTPYTNKGALYYDILGFRCVRSINVIADVGKIKATGKPEINDFDMITGAIIIKAERSSPIMEWIWRANQQVDLILDIFSLAGGRYLDWARRSIFMGDQWVQTLFKSPVRRGKPVMPVFHYLNMQPILDIAIKNYNKQIKQETGFGIALEQFLISSLYIESQFTTNFMALEHFVNSYVRQSGEQTILHNNEFNDFVMPEIKKALKESKENIKKNREALEVKGNSLKKAFQAMEGKIKELNRYTFVRNMWKFINEIKVPLDGLLKEEIEKVVQTRHTLIHSGSSTSRPIKEDENQRGLLLLRELLTRIFLTLLKYEGNYNSFLHGHQYTQFPPVAK
jgi:hypothetical protein